MKTLVINCGSSSIKYKLYEMPEERLLVKGVLEKIGEEVSVLKHQPGAETIRAELKVKNHSEGLQWIAQHLLDKEKGVVKRIEEIEAVGHRVVHGGEGFERSVRIDDDVVRRIEEYQDLAPLHNPPNLAGIRAARSLFPHATQVAAFDTAFHTSIPQVCYLYAIPYELYEKHRVRRYGFHGTSHRYVARKAAELLGRGKYDINVITCHLGNGCSITAARNGHSVDTSMGLTPLEGLIMGTRSGDIDPGVIFYLADRLGYDLKQLNSLLNKESGLLGVSGVSNDFRNLLDAAAKGNNRAALAIEMFCYRLKKYIGSYMAVLGETHAIVFTGGIGENVPLVREKSLDNMEKLGIEVDRARNSATVGRQGEISTPDSPVKVLVIPTDEELRIAHDAYALANGAASLSRG